MKLLLPVLLLLLVAGCAIPERGDPAFAPTMPPPVKIPPGNSDSIYQRADAVMLYEDLKAHRVGDMVTVLLNEKTDASKNAETVTSKESILKAKGTVGGKTVTAGGIPVLDNNYDSGIDFTGTGDSKQSNKLTGNVVVTVVRVLHNGNLVVQGEKWISINQSEEYVRLRGIIRPTDISPDNTILSSRVANAQIEYGGKGAISDSSSMGWLSRFFNSSWMPF